MAQFIERNQLVDGWRMRCNCGAVGPWREFMVNADADCKDHREECVDGTQGILFR